jgi:hypothetical protein
MPSARAGAAPNRAAQSASNPQRLWVVILDLFRPVLIAVIAPISLLPQKAFTRQGVGFHLREMRLI